MGDRNIVIFGAGKIGRSFIGQIFGNAGYEVIYVDTDQTLVQALNRRNEYPLIIKGPRTEQRMIIKHVRAVHGSNLGEVIKAVSESSIMAISVGKAALPAIAPGVAQGLMERERNNPGRILDIILAENMRDAAYFFREKLRESLPAGYLLNQRVGLVETSIGKMVPIMTASDLLEDPLQVFAEPYNTLILDKKGFRGTIPDIKELALKENMKAWVDRKAFIHNLGHATAAYCGHLKHPGATYMYEVLADTEVHDFTRRVMLEAAQILLSVYPAEFTRDDLINHIEDLLTRFRNRNLGDTVFRVGSDLSRKLGKDDRFMGIIRLAGSVNMPSEMILKAMSRGLRFKGKDENGTMYPGDVEFHKSWELDREGVLREVCGLTGKKDAELIAKLEGYND
jgi:mannitol-1-phosphate 5-dehydrogenase